MQRSRIGLCWGSVPGGTLIDIARTASGQGLAAITVTAGHFQAAGPDVRARLADLGVRVAVVDPLMQPLPGMPPIDEVPEAMRHFFTYDEDMCWRAAEALEAPTVNLAHFMGRPVERSRMVDTIGGLVRLGRAHGIELTIEFIPGTGIPDLATAHDLARATGARVMLDTWHLVRSGGGIADIAALPPGSIGAVQLSDHRTPPPGTPYVPMSGRLLPGDGELQLTELIAAIEANSPGLDLCLEIFSGALEALGWDEAARLMVAATERVLP